MCVYIHRTGLKSNNSDLILPCYWFNQHFILFVTAFSVEIITFYNGKFKRIKNYFQKYQINNLINEHFRKNVHSVLNEFTFPMSFVLPKSFKKKS